MLEGRWKYLLECPSTRYLTGTCWKRKDKLFPIMITSGMQVFNVKRSAYHATITWLKTPLSNFQSTMIFKMERLGVFACLQAESILGSHFHRRSLLCNSFIYFHPLLWSKCKGLIEAIGQQPRKVTCFSVPLRLLLISLVRTTVLLINLVRQHHLY